MRVRSTGLLTLALCGVAAAQTPPAPAAPTPAAPAPAFVPAGLAPADSLAFVGWRGTADPGPDYAGSRWAAATKESQFGRLIDETLPGIGAIAERRFPQDGPLIRAAATVVRQVLRKPSAAFFGMTDDGPCGGVLCHGGADAGALAQAFGRLAAKLPPQAKAVAIAEGDRVGLVFGYADGAAVTGGLDREPQFAAATKQVSADPTFVGYVNAVAARPRIEALLARHADDDQERDVAAYVKRFLDASGLDGVNAVITSAGFDGRDWRTDAFVDAPAPRKGLLDVTAPAAPDAAVLARVPASAHTVTAFYFDPNKALAAVRSVAEGVDPRGGDWVDKAVGAATLAVGKNVQTELLASLGTTWAAYTSPVTGGSGGAGVVLVNKLADPLKAKQAMAAVSIFLSNTARNLTPDRRVTVAGRTTRVGDLTVYYVAAPVVSPAWTIKDGYLYLGLFPQTVVSAARYGGPPITDVPAFADAAKLAGPGVPLTVSYTDVASTMGEGYGLAMALSRTAFGLSDVFLAPTPELLLPPLESLRAQTTPAVGVAWADDAGLHGRTRSPYPGAEELANLSLSSLYFDNVPATLGVLLPSLNRAREQARRVASMSHLRQIGIGCMIYANDHNGRLPPDFATLLRTQAVAVDVFLRPGGDTPRPPVPPGVDPVDVYAPWVDEHGDYVYVGAATTTRDAKPNAVVAYEKPTPDGEGIDVLFVDGHVEFVLTPQVDEVFAAGKATPPAH